MCGGWSMNEYSLEKYLDLKSHIEELELKKRMIRAEFYQQSFYTRCGYDYDNLTMYTTAPKIDNAVVELILECDCVDRQLKRNKQRLRYFERYLGQLSQEERKSLYSGSLPPKLEEETLDEIEQIEIALCYQEGRQVPEEKLTQDPLENLERLLAIV